MRARARCFCLFWPIRSRAEIGLGAAHRAQRAGSSGRPVVDVGVEGADGDQDRVGVFAAVPDPVVAVGDDPKAFLPAAGDVVGEVQRVDAGLVQLEVTPEQQHELGGELSERRVVERRLAFVEVVDEQAPDGGVLDPVAVDEFGHGALPDGAQAVSVARGVVAAACRRGAAANTTASVDGRCRRAGPGTLHGSPRR